MWVLPLFLFFLTIAVRCLMLRWPKGERNSDDEQRPPPVAAKALARPETLEGVLVAQLVAGEISRRQYARAMEQLAVRDDERHPIAVPPDVGKAGK